MSADVPESRIRLIARGEQVEVRLAAYPDTIFRARVVRIADVVDPQTRTIRVMAELGNADGRLRPDMFGEIRHAANFRLTPVVPAGAVLQTHSGTAVWREKAPGVFEFVRVKSGRASNGRVPVFSGIEAGDRVVVDGATLLEGGARGRD
jgi:membrane fusion protein, heavy metal efflux system